MKKFIDKLIERLEESKQKHPCWDAKCDKCKYTEDCWEGEECYKVEADNIISIVNELAEEYSANSPQKSAGGWIPCSKKRPEAGTHRDVWISIENEVVAYRAKWYLDHFEWENGWVIKEPILAWMPNDVPEAYQLKGE